MVLAGPVVLTQGDRGGPRCSIVQAARHLEEAGGAVSPCRGIVQEMGSTTGSPPYMVLLVGSDRMDWASSQFVTIVKRALFEVRGRYVGAVHTAHNERKHRAIRCGHNTWNPVVAVRQPRIQLVKRSTKPET